MARLAKIGWFILCGLVLLYYALNRQVHDADIVACYGMIALSFPLGWAGAAATGWFFAGLDRLFGYTAPKNLGVFFFWLLAVGLGYYQWFVLLPRAIRMFKTKRDNHVA
jgi:hypothetical protein